MIAILNWEAPPPARRKGVLGQVDRVVEELKKRPGEWARVENEATGSTAAKKWESSGCEVVVRTIEVEEEGSKPKKRYRIWVRWPAAAKTSQREAAEAYARQHGHVPQRPAGTPAAPKPLPAGTELTPEGVKQQLARRLGHKS